jgi:PKD repeat protein
LFSNTILVSGIFPSGLAAGGNFTIGISNMRNPVNVGTASDSYTIKTTSSDSYGIDSKSTGLTITSNSPGNVTVL